MFFSRLEMKARRLHPVPLRALWGRALKISIQLTEKGIKISCDGEEAFIDLTPDEGITISCKKDLNVNAEGEVKVQAETIKLIADEKISLGTDRAFIDITDETITLLGKEVIVE